MLTMNSFAFFYFFCMQLFTVCHSSFFVDCKKREVCYHEGTISIMGWNKTSRFFIQYFCRVIQYITVRIKLTKLKQKIVRMKVMERLSQTKKGRQRKPKRVRTNQTNKKKNLRCHGVSKGKEHSRVKKNLSLKREGRNNNLECNNNRLIC